MKVTNDFVIVDLETTASQDEDGFQQNNDIIQIGAVLLDRELNPINEYQSIIKPREPVSDFITNLTGITDAAAQAARPFPVAMAEFESWVTSHVKNIKNVRLCFWGSYFDMPILRRQYQEYLLKFPFSGTAFDAKTLAMQWMSLQDRRTDKLSVSYIAGLMGYEGPNNFHDALTDSKAEAYILKRAMTDLNRGTFLDGKLVKLV